MERPAYAEKYGDPTKNDRGDKLAYGLGGKELVLMAGDRIWTKKVQKISRAVRSFL